MKLIDFQGQRLSWLFEEMGNIGATQTVRKWVSLSVRLSACLSFGRMSIDIYIFTSRVVVVTFQEKMSVFDACTLQQRFWVMSE